MLSAETEGLNSVVASLTAADAAVSAMAGRALRETAQDVESTAKSLAPVRTGTLRRSISHTVRNVPGGAEATIGSDVPYAIHQEKGTSRMAPRAFLGPALDRHSGEFVERLSRLSGDILR